MNECLPALENLRKGGKIGFIGVTGYPLEKLKEAIVKAPGRFDVVLGYARYTLIDHSFVEYLPFFKEANLGVVCAAGHAMKMLTNSGPEHWHPADDEIKLVCKQAREMCMENDIDLGKLAMYHFLQFEGPSTFLVGCAFIFSVYHFILIYFFLSFSRYGN